MFSLYLEDQEISFSDIFKDIEDISLSPITYSIDKEDKDYNFFLLKNREEKIVENINEGYFNNELKKEEKKKYFQENTKFTSKKSSSKIINENQNNLVEIKKIENFPENSINKNIFLTKNINELKEKKQKRILGRKLKNSDESGGHDKFSDDNLSRRSKHIILDKLFSFINYLIEEFYDENNLSYKNRQFLLKINQRQVINSKVDYNISFLNKKLKDIFSDNISTKYKRYLPQHNKILIEKLLNEKDESKKVFFEKIFNLTFLDCLKHFRGEINIKELEGFARLDEVCEQFKKEKDYEYYGEQFKYFIYNFEKIIMSKKVRKRDKRSLCPKKEKKLKNSLFS